MRFELLLLGLVAGHAGKAAPGPCERPLYFAEGATAVEVDLDCDGTPNEMQIGVGPDSSGVTRRWLELRGSSVEIPVEASLEIVGIGDLDEDALDDVLLLGTAPGIAIPVVVLSTVSGGVVARFQSTDMARSANLLLHEDVYADCPRVVRSVRFMRTSRGLGVSVPSGYGEEVTCAREIPRFVFVVVGDTLVLAPD